MNQIKFHLDRIFNSGTDAKRLDAFRVIMPLAVVVLFSRLPWEVFGDVPACVWNPPGMAGIFLPTSLSVSQITFLKTSFLVSMVTLSLGLLSRVSSATAAICLFLLVGNSIGAHYADRSANPLILVLAVLSLSPCLGVNYSIDSWLFKKRRRSDSDSIWPARLIQFLFFFTFFSAGYIKLNHSGFAWIDTENIAAKWIWAG